MIDKQRHIDLFKGIINDFYPTIIDAEYGSEGTSSLKGVLDSIQEIYKYIYAGGVNKITIFKYDDISQISSKGVPIHLTQFSSLTQYQYSSKLTIQLINGEECYILLDDIEAEQIAKATFLYQKEKNKEFIITGKRKNQLPNSPDIDSIFAINTFKSLDEAIEYYKTSIVKPAKCQKIRDSFINEKRLLFNPGPEHFLRDSMENFLKTRLRGNPEVRIEQTIDGSHPVDIKVSWLEAKHIALIEIKWIGKSINFQNNIITYTDARAREGAQQLADYLDGNFGEVPTHTTRGYLVVFDGRRKNPTNSRDNLSNADGFRFEFQEIEFDPKHHEVRKDFNIPVRLFINPVCN